MSTVEYTVGGEQKRNVGTVKKERKRREEITSLPQQKDVTWKKS